MASFTSVNDELVLDIPERNEQIAIALSGTYAMTILFQREVGSKGSGTWETLRTYSTANATVAETYTSIKENDRVRLFVSVDTSGTCVATLTDSSDKVIKDFQNAAGTSVLKISQSGVTIKGDLTMDTAGTGGILGPAAVVLTAATVLTRASHANRPIILNNATGFKVNLPNATGSGDVYDFYVGTTVSSGSHEINAFEVGDDDINGVIVGVDPPGDEFTWGAQGTENMISLGGTSNATGGFKGDNVRLVDILAGLWSARGGITQDGSEATPFGTDS
jgi:hypothetical protein